MKIATKTVAAIEAAPPPQAHRPHLGASAIGNPCARALWYTFRWAKRPQFDARMLRLFERGQREEKALASVLARAGITFYGLDPSTGCQFAFSDLGGHIGGSMDGCAVGLPDDPETWHVVEFKTHGEKSFNALAKNGVVQSKPEHHTQMQLYMHWSGMTKALYVAVCKNTDRLHLERVDYDAQHAQEVLSLVRWVIDSSIPPDKLSLNYDFHACKLCQFAPICHGTEVPEPTCRTCCASTMRKGGGEWVCDMTPERVTLPHSDQSMGCHSHVYIPDLLRNIAPAMDSEHGVEWWVEYRASNGTTWRNGLNHTQSRTIWMRQQKADDAAP